MKKQIVIWIIAMILMIGMGNAAAISEKNFDLWDGSIDTSWAEDYSTSSDFTLTTAAQLAGLRNLVWEGKNFENKIIRLGANMDFNHLNWKYGIGGRKDNSWGAGTNLQFKGTFAGDGYVLKNISINPNIPDASEAAGQNVDDETLSKNSALGFFGYTAAAGICGVNLENVTITFHNTQGDTGNNILYQVGGLAGFSADSSYSACTVKSISFCGGWAAYADIPADVNIGGLIGDLHSGKVYNCYVDTIDYTKMTQGRINSRAYKAGLLCVTNSGPTISNVYVVNMKYDKEHKTELWEGNEEYDMYNFNTAIYCRKNTDTAYHTFNTNGKIFTDRYDYRRSSDLLTGVEEPVVATVFSEDSGFETMIKDGVSVSTMVDLREFGVPYPVTAAEKIFAVTAVCYDGDREVSDLSQVTGNTVEIKFKSYNTTGVEQTFDVLAGGYMGNILQQVQLSAVTLTNTISAPPAGRWDAWQPWAYGKTEEEMAKAQIVEGSFRINKEDFDKISIFCWNSVQQLTPLSPVYAIAAE